MWESGVETAGPSEVRWAHARAVTESSAKGPRDLARTVNFTRDLLTCTGAGGHAAHASGPAAR